MKADMLALKDQMAPMMEAMLSMRRLIESNAATAASASTTVEADPVLPSATNQAHQLTPDMVGRGGDALGNTSSLHRGYKRGKFDYVSLPTQTVEDPGQLGRKGRKRTLMQ